MLVWNKSKLKAYGHDGKTAIYMDVIMTIVDEKELDNLLSSDSRNKMF